MKHLILVLFVTIQTIVSSSALAWFPLDGLETAVESMQYCYSTIAGSDEDQEGKKKEVEEVEEEEPDCD